MVFGVFAVLANLPSIEFQHVSDCSLTSFRFCRYPMKVTQENLPASQIGLEIEVPADLSQSTYERVVQDFMKSISLPGFRKGKVPRQVLLQRVGSTQLKQATVEALLQKAFEEAFKQVDRTVIGTPELAMSFEDLSQTYEPGAALTISAKVDVNPEVVLKQYQNFEVKAEENPYDPSQVDNVLQDYQKRVATLVPVEGRTAQVGDTTIVDYRGQLVGVDTSEQPDAADFPGNEAQDFQVELESGRFIEGFIEGIVGMEVGQTKEILVQFPDNYSLEDVAGKEVLFSITLKELKERELPELDDDFAQEVSDFETLAELRQSLEERYQKDATSKTQRNKEQALIEALLPQVEVEIPETLVRREVDYLLTQTAMQLQSQGLDIKQFFTQDTLPRLREETRSEAIQSLKRSLALVEIAKQQSITVDEADIATKIRAVKQDYKENEIDENRLREVITEEMLTEKVMLWLENHSQVTLVPPGTLTPTEEDEPDQEQEIDSTTIDVAAESVPEESSLEAEPDAEPAVATVEAAEQSDQAESSKSASAKTSRSSSRSKSKSS
jgi:trigger factor